MTFKKSLFFVNDNHPLHVKALDGLRGVAVICVLLSHAGNEGLHLFSFLQFYKMGKIGVYIFFILSAYLLDRQIAQALIQGKSSFKYWSNYLFRRIIRIYPLFIISLIIHFLMNLYLTPTVIANIQDIKAHLILQKGESMFWSIPVEFKYYFLSPLIMLVCHHIFKWNKKVIFSTLIISILLSLVLHAKFNFDRITTLRYFPFFLMGTILSIWEMLDLKSFNLWGLKLKKIGYLAIFVFILTIPFLFEKLFRFNVNFQHSIYYIPYAILWGTILLVTKTNELTFGKIFTPKWLRFVGIISFSVYLFHKPILYLIVRDIIPCPIIYQPYLFVILSISFSVFSYILIEFPLSRIKLYKKF